MTGNCKIAFRAVKSHFGSHVITDLADSRRGITFGPCRTGQRFQHSLMLLFREKIPADWLPKVLGNLSAVLVDHAHLERKAATSALNLEKYHELFPRVEELNAIALEELQQDRKS